MTGWLLENMDMQIEFVDAAQARLRSRPRVATLFSAMAGICAVFVVGVANAGALSPEDKYIATRDAAIKKLSPLYDAGALDDAATKAEAAAFADLLAQMTAILKQPTRQGFGPAKLNIETFYKGDEGFGTLDGLRFDAELGKTGEKAGGNGADGKYVEPKTHIIVTTQSLFERWLLAHKDWWDKGAKNVPQRIGSALKDESFYTQAISSGAAVINFNLLPMAKPATATFAYGILAGRTQSEIPDAADEVFVSALADGKVYVAYGSIDPEVKIPECIAIRTDYNKRSETADDDFRFKKIDQKAYDKLGNLRQQGEDAFRRCFTRRAPQQASFAEATRQAQALLAAAVAK
jgi:hypothetical protein